MILKKRLGRKGAASSRPLRSSFASFAFKVFPCMQMKSVLLVLLMRATVNCGARDAHRLAGLLAVCGRLIDRVHHFHPARDATEGGELSVQMRRITGEDEEVCGRAIGSS